MRDIIFRGKRIDNGEWVTGYYGQFHNRPTVNEENTHKIFEPREDAYLCGSMIGGLWHIVHPLTIGQYTGLSDKGGKRIFEGDILFDPHPSVQKSYSVIWFSGSFVRRTVDGHYLSISVLNADEYEVIGNIYDNSELLK